MKISPGSELTAEWGAEAVLQITNYDFWKSWKKTFEKDVYMQKSLHDLCCKTTVEEGKLLFERSLVVWKTLFRMMQEAILVFGWFEKSSRGAVSFFRFLRPHYNIRLDLHCNKNLLPGPYSRIFFGYLSIIIKPVFIM